MMTGTAKALALALALTMTMTYRNRNGQWRCGLADFSLRRKVNQSTFNSVMEYSSTTTTALQLSKLVFFHQVGDFPGCLVVINIKIVFVPTL